jgi:dTDP-4-dehydrorhamnose reductase
MRILLIGAAGQLGTDLRSSLPRLGEVISTTRDGTCDGASCVALDVTDIPSIARVIELARPDVVVNATAYTAVDRAESEPDVAFRVNGDAPGHMALACARVGARFVHYSTDYVFDGLARAPYAEGHPLAPASVYGASKAAGEAAVSMAGARSLIVRTSWVYSFHGHNFLRTMLRLGNERESLQIVADQVGCPTPSWFIAETTTSLLESKVDAPIVHVATSGATSWHDFATEIFRLAVARGLVARVPSVQPVTTAQYPTPARRPAYSVLDTTLLGTLIGTDVPRWDAALETTFESVR